MSLREVVVVGAGAAGLTAAETLRDHGYAGRMRIIGAERHLPYDRPPLSKYVVPGTWEPSRVRLRSEVELGALDADLRLGVRAAGLDPGERELHLSTGESIRYDGLVLATGVQPRQLRTGHRLAGVHVLRTLDDALALRDELAAAPTVVVIGAGLLGCEVAASARGLGLDVTLVDAQPSPMHRQIGPVLGGLVATLHADHGTVVRCGAGVAHLIGGAVWVVGEIRCLGPGAGRRRGGAGGLVVLVVAEQVQHRAGQIVDIRRPGPLVVGGHWVGWVAASFWRLRFSSTSTCHFSLAAVVSTSISKRSVMSGVMSATST